MGVTVYFACEEDGVLEEFLSQNKIKDLAMVDEIFLSHVLLFGVSNKR